MDIRQLTYFVAIAECGSFSEASRRCFISQSAISQQIKLLEDELKTVLFLRTSHRVSLTESGELLLPLARKTLEDIERCKERMNEVNDMLTGTLSIGLTYSLESYLRKPIVRFMRLHPNVQLNVVYKTMPELMRLLHNNDLDLSFGITTDGECDWVEQKPVLQYRLCAVMRDTHPLAGRQTLSFSDLRMQRIILPEAGIRDQNAAEHFLTSKAKELRNCVFINDVNAILNILKMSNCVSILPEHIAEGDDGLVAVPISELDEPFTSMAYVKKCSFRKKSIDAFLGMLS